MLSDMEVNYGPFKQIDQIALRQTHFYHLEQSSSFAFFDVAFT